MSRNKLLTVLLDFEKEWLCKTKNTLSKFEHLHIESCDCAAEFLYILPQLPDVVVMDCLIWDIEAGKLIEIILEYNPDCKIIIQSEQIDIETIQIFLAGIDIQYIEKGKNASKELEIFFRNYIENKFKLLFDMDDAIRKRKELLGRFRDDLHKYVENKKAGKILEEFWKSKHSAQ